MSSAPKTKRVKRDTDSTLSSKSTLREDVHQSIKTTQQWIKNLETYGDIIEKWNKESQQINNALQKITEALVPFSKCSGICKNHCVPDNKKKRSK